MITAAELAVKVTADTSQAESGLKSFSGKMGNIGGQMAAVGGILSATIAAPLIGIGVTAVKTAADFERSMNVLGYATEASASQMQSLSDQALQLGADTVFSANEAAEGMVDLAKAGMTTEEIMGSIGGVMDLAAAGAIGVSDAANITAAALNTFNLDATESGRVADVLAAAANASTAEVSDLAFGLQNAGAVFASSGQSVESLATMMALLANNGINASDAATSLKTMTMRLTAPTKVAAKEMKRLGINVFDAEGNMRDYRDIVSDLEGATRGMSDAQQAAAFNTIFGADAIRAATILSQEGAAGYESMATAVSEQGAAAAMAEAQNKGLSGALQSIAGTIETLGIKLATPFEDDITAWTNSINDFIKKIGELPQPVINAALAFAGFAIALSTGALALAGIIKIMPLLLTPIGLTTLAILGLGAAAAALWAAWQTNFMNIQGTMAPVAEAFTTARMAIEDFGRYLGVAAQEGDVFNAWLLSVPPAFVPFAEAAARAVIAAQTLGTQLSNLGHYLLEVALKGVALNIWLFTMSPALADFALMLGNGLIALQNFAAAAANFKLPTLAELQTSAEKLTGDIAIQLTATVETLLDPPQLTIAPFPPMTIPAPEITIAPAAGAAGQLAGAAAKGAAVGGAVGVARMIDSVSETVEAGNWEGAGKLIAAGIVAAWNTEMAKLKTLLKWTGVFGDVIAGWVSFNAGLFAALTGFSTDLAALDIAGSINAFGKKVKDAALELMRGLTGGLVGAIPKPPDATSLSDTLRTRNAAAQPKMPDFSGLTAGINGAFVAFESITGALGTMQSTVSGFVWPAVIAAFTWPQTIFDFKWPKSLAFDWHTWIQPLDWGRFIGGLFGGGTTPGTKSTGATGPHPGIDPGDSGGRVRPEFMLGGEPAAVAMAAYGGGYANSGVVIRIDAVNVHNDMDIEELAAKLARRFQQKLR